MAYDELLILVLTAVVPEAGHIAVTKEAAVGDVCPAARADVIHPALKVGIGAVGQTGIAVPKTQGVAAVCDDVRVQDGDAVRVFHRANRELMIVVASKVVVYG